MLTLAVATLALAGAPATKHGQGQNYLLPLYDLVTNETSSSLLKPSTDTEPDCCKEVRIAFSRTCCLSGLSQPSPGEAPLPAGLLGMRLSLGKSEPP